MAEEVFVNRVVALGGLSLQAQKRALTLLLTAEPQDTTALDDLTRTRLGGLQDVALSSEGYFDAAEPDASLFAAVGVSDSLITATQGVTLGQVAYFFRAMVGAYNPVQGAVGEPHMYTLEAGANLGDLYRGTLMENDTADITATGNGTGRQIGAVSAGQSIYAGVHAHVVTGDWDIVLESDDNAGFTSAVTRATFSNVTGVGDQFATVAGAITDDYWRFRYVENSAGTLRVVASLAIQ